jgi:two-component system, sensor histidine kinase
VPPSPPLTDSLRNSVTRQALEAQRALLPYALAAFAISLPIYVWAASHAPNAGWMALSFAVFAINWGCFYAAHQWIRASGPEALVKRGRIQAFCGLLWAGAVVQMSVLAHGAGPVREPLMFLALAAAIMVIFFSTPWLPSLLLVAPLAVAGPLIALYAEESTRGLANVAWGAVALSFALALIFNRTLRNQFALAAEREELMTERARSLAGAERLARSKSDLVATLSCEIKNGRLSSVAQVLAAAAGRGGRGQPSREQLSAALDAANDLIEVLNTTLDSETAEAGRLKVDAKPFDAAALVRDLALLNRAHAQTKGLELAVHIAPELATGAAGACLADAPRVRQILANLLGNALKYTVRGRVEARVDLAAPNRLAIEVADTGPGLTAEEIEQAFEPFVRIERTGAGVPGAGLGLSLSRQLARLMGGDLIGSGALGVGSCFRLELPFDAGSEPARPGEIDAPEAVGERTALRVLISEDDALNAASLRSLLEELGHQVVHAHDGRRAAELTKLLEFDLVMAGGRQGPETIAAIRALPTGASIVPIIAVIGGEAEEGRACTEAGADVVLRRPVGVAQLARAVAQATHVEPVRGGHGAAA